MQAEQHDVSCLRICKDSSSADVCVRIEKSSGQCQQLAYQYRLRHLYPGKLLLIFHDARHVFLCIIYLVFISYLHTAGSPLFHDDLPPAADAALPHRLFYRYIMPLRTRAIKRVLGKVTCSFAQKNCSRFSDCSSFSDAIPTSCQQCGRLPPFKSNKNIANCERITDRDTFTIILLSADVISTSSHVQRPCR